MSDRKLIRPSMTEMMERFPSRASGRRKQVPAEQTNAESFYYLKQMQGTHRWWSCSPTAPS